MKNHTFRTLHILFAAVMMWSTACEDSIINSDNTVDNTNFEAQESFAFSLPVTNQSRIDIRAINGSITIYTGEDIDSLKITGKRRVRSESSEDARVHLADLHVHIVERNETIYVSTEQPNDSYGRTYLVDYVVKAPIHWQLRVDQINGNINIDTVFADIEAILTNGNIVLNHVNGCAYVDLVNGIIKADVTVPDAGQCSLKNVNGQILLSIPVTTSALFHASVVNGTVAVKNLDLSELDSSPKHIEGRLGAGTSNISCTLVNGQIVVSGTVD